MAKGDAKICRNSDGIKGDVGIDENAFADLLAEIAARRDEFRSQRYISQDIIAKLKALGLYRAFVPECFGGAGMAPNQFLKMIERLAAADGSVGCDQISFVIALCDT